VSNTRRTIQAEDLEATLGRAFIHSREDGTFCAGCGVKLTSNHKLHACTSCLQPLGAVVVDGGNDIQLLGRPTYYVERAAVAEQGYPS
jgi:predicted amidophosphoribosyltransferase